MGTMLYCVFMNSIYLIPCSFLYFLFIKMGEKKYKAGLQYFLGILVIFFYIIPVRIMVNIPILSQEMPSKPENDFRPISNHFLETAEVIVTTFDIDRIMISVFVIGMLASIALKLTKHICFLRYVNRWKEYLTDASITDIVRKTSDELKIKGKVKFYHGPGLRSPAVIGIWKPYIVLPDKITCGSDELYLIIKHELIHIKRKDILIKYFCTFVRSVYWFNPLVYVLKNNIDIQCELSCDEMVVQKQEFDVCKKYGICIIKAYQNSFAKPVNSIFVSKLNSNRAALYKRINALAQREEKKISVLAPALLLIGLIVSTANLTVRNDYSNQWTKNFGENIKLYRQEPSAYTPEGFAPFLGIIKFEYTFYDGETPVNEEEPFFIGVSAYEAVVLKEIDVHNQSQLDALARMCLERSIKAKETLEIGYTYTYTVQYPEQINNINKEKYLK